MADEGSITPISKPADRSSRPISLDVCTACGFRMLGGTLCSYDCPADGTNPKGRTERVEYVPVAEVERLREAMRVADEDSDHYEKQTQKALAWATRGNWIPTPDEVDLARVLLGLDPLQRPRTGLT